VVRDDHRKVVYSHRHLEPGEVDDKRDPASLCSKRDIAKAELADVLPGWFVGITYTNPSDFTWMRRIVSVQMGLLILAGALVVLGTFLTTRFSLGQMELSRLKSHFVSNITHELKTPLAAIRLYTETLQQGRLRDRAEADRFLGIIHKETVRLTALINGILDFARIEAGQRRYDFKPESVGDVVREVVDTYAYQLRDKGFELEVAIDPDLPPASIDRDAVGQAVLNLLDNAVKYSRERKEVSVAVRHTNGTSPVKHVAIEVRDRGIGILGSEQRRIFDAFYRVEKGLEHEVKGSGLGLAVVKQIAEAHGGHVSVESDLGDGSRFTLYLPVAPAAIEGDVWETQKA
jgi:two-component system phosphate regulon sensor histidine kinase PhoR